MMIRPPRAAELLLNALLDDQSREAVVGDLHEGYVEVHKQRGAHRAAWWYVREAARSVVTCRITGRRQRDARRHDFDEGAAYSLRDLLRPAVRQFRDQPLYALTAAGTLALAIGAVCASVAVVKRALIDPLPYRDDHELVSLLTVADGLRTAVSPHVLEDLRASAPPLVEFAAVRPTGLAYAADGATQTVTVNIVDPEYFKLLGVTAARGRLWARGEPDAVVVSAAFWRDELASDEQAVGRSIVIDGRTRTVVGVLPPDFMPPYFSTAAIWAPLDVSTLLSDPRQVRTLTILARRSAGTTQQDLDSFMALFSRQLQERFPALHGNQAWIAVPLRDELVGSTRPALIGTAAGAALLLLIVAANIAGLSTAHAMATRHQLAVRAALGATRGRLLTEQIVDSVAIALGGSLVGIWIAYGLVTIIGRYQEHFLGRLAPIQLDSATVAAGVVTGIGIGVIAALLPQRIVGAAPADALRSTRGSTGDVTISATRTALVIAQVAIALVLLVGAGLIVQTVLHLSQRPLGFHSTGLTWVQVTLPGKRYESTEAQLQFERDALDRLARIPGVSSATASVGFPLWGGMMAGFRSKTDAPGTALRDVAYLSVSPNFVKDIGATILAGRDLHPTDTANSTRVVVINETMARLFWPKGDALGAEVQIGRGSPTERWITVVGIMADMRAHGLMEPIRPTAFGSTLQYSWPRRHLAVRMHAPSQTLATELKSAIHAVDPAVAIGVVTAAEQSLANSMARHRLVMLALILFGTVALVLCVSGLYAVVALNSQQRRREYAIRVALGAGRGGVRWMVVRQALSLAAAGAVVGLAVAAFGTRTLQGLLHGVDPIDAPTFALATACLFSLATIAAWQPAAHAEKVDPAETLRAE